MSERRRGAAAWLAVFGTISGAALLAGCQAGDRKTESGERSQGINNNSNTHSGAAPGPGAPEETSNGATTNTGRTTGLTGQQVTSSGASPGATLGGNTAPASPSGAATGNATDSTRP